MPDYFLKKKPLLDRFKDNHGRTGYIQSARAEHTWSNPIKRNRRTKELNGWINSFAGKKHIRKLARFNTLNNGKNEGYNMENFDCLRYGSTLELPNGVCIPVNATIRCPRRAPFTFRITDIRDAEAGNPSKYVIRGYYPVYGPEQKPSDEFDIPCNDVSEIEEYMETTKRTTTGVDEKRCLQSSVVYRGSLEDAKAASRYLAKIIADTGRGWGLVSWSAPKDGEYHYGHPEKDIYTVKLRGSDQAILDSYATYKDAYNDEFWYNCEASPNGWVDPLDMKVLNVAESIKESKGVDEKLKYEKGHKNSKGEDAPWVIRSHKDNRILASFANKKDAEEHMQRMKQYSKTEKKSEAVNIGGFKNMLRTYNAKGGSVKNGPWRICDGAYDLWFELYYNETPILGCTDNLCKWYSNPETVGMTHDDYKKIEDAISSEIFAIDSFKMPESKNSETKEDGERCVDDYDTLTEGLSELGFVPSSNIRNGMIYPYRSRFTATKDGVKYHFWIHEDPSGEYTDYIEVWGGKFTTNGDPEDPETTKFNTVSDVLDALKSVKKSEAHDLDTYKSDVFSDLVVNLFHGKDGAKKLVDEYADAIEDAFARGDTSMEIATEIDTMAGKHESKDVSLKEIARTLDTAINKDGNYSVKDNTSGVTATDKDRTQTIKVSKDLKVELEDKDGKHSYEAQSLRDLSKYIRRAVKGEYVNEDFHKTQVKDAVYDVINRHNLNNAVKVSYSGNSVVCKYADRTLRIQPDLLTTMSTKDGDNVDTYPTNLKELDGYLDRVFGHYADELAESKQSEGIKLKLLDTITVPQWLWEAYTYSQEYSLDEYGVDLNDDEMAIFYDFKEKYKDCRLDDRGAEPDFHSRNDFDCYGGNCYIVDVYTMTDVNEKKSEKLFNKQELEAHATGADILDQLQYRFSFSFYSPKTYTDAVDTALAMNADGDKRIAHETIGDSEFRLYTDDPYDAIRFRDGLSNRAGIPAEDLASTFRSAVGIRKNGGYATEDEQDTIGRYAAENYVSFSVSEDNSTIYVEGELPNVVEFFEAISSVEPA